LFSNPLKKTTNIKLPSITISSKELGDWSENLACDWLMGHKLKLEESNFRRRYGEIDLIMKDQGCLVFVEVRYRKNTTFGSAEESVNQKKCQRLIATAENYLLINGYGINTNLRFDVVAISPAKESDLHCTINWIKNILL
tara:strand:- start:3070 stop:3489 length:420 start_codon:yes stop_codon:yes gene_type:complete